MTYVIAEPCIDVLDRACVEECPVDCIDEGERALYIHPEECVDCGACEPVCPVEAILLRGRRAGPVVGVHRRQRPVLQRPLPGQAGPLDSPGDAGKTGRIGADSILVAGYPPRT